MDFLDIIQVLLVVIVLFSIFGLATLNLIEVSTLDKATLKEVKCYDRLNNEIIGQKCIEEVQCGVVSKYFNICER